MNSISKIAALSILPIMISACASTPNPAKVCTAEWIAPRADRAVERIEKKASRAIKTLAAASQTLAEGKTPGLFQSLAASRALGSLEKELKNGKGIQDLRTVAKTCNDPEIISDGMRSLLERQGVSDSFISQIESFGIYQDLISGIAEPETSS
ncbi:hypothetical protein [Litorimonas sp. WD9-15]|uniref:hypothetical protein n=1 Tax=Litorimonas sp. WD9-15 TaxID=3418716 RepID=UPI003D0800F4